MADILIRGMEMPDRALLPFCLHPDGTVYTYGEPKMKFRAIELPEHGDLIDRSKIKFTCASTTPEDLDYARRYVIDRMPVIIPANKEKTK